MKSPLGIQWLQQFSRDQTRSTLPVESVFVPKNGGADKPGSSDPTLSPIDRKQSPQFRLRD